MIGGALVMALGTLPGAVPRLPLLLASRLAVGAGEAAMMAAAVLWLLRLAGPAHRGRALGHIGLANYAGLAAGPPLAHLVGDGHPGRVLLLAAALPVVAAALTAALGREPGSSTSGSRPTAGTSVLLRATARPGLGLLLVNIGYVAVLGFAAAAASARQVQLGALAVPLFGIGVIAGRAVLGWVPDRCGAGRTLCCAVVAEAAGLAVIAVSSCRRLTIAALLVLAIGQGLAVPSLGVLALAAVPPCRPPTTARPAACSSGTSTRASGSADPPWVSSQSTPTRPWPCSRPPWRCSPRRRSAAGHHERPHRLDPGTSATTVCSWSRTSFLRWCLTSAGHRTGGVIGFPGSWDGPAVCPRAA